LACQRIGKADADGQFISLQTLICINEVRQCRREIAIVHTVRFVEDYMFSTPVEVKKATPAPTPVPDVWRSFRSEMDRLFDRFSTSFAMPSLRRMFDMEPTWRFESSFNFAAPAIDVSEDEKAYKISAELPGLEAKDLDVSIVGDTLVIKGEKQQEK